MKNLKGPIEGAKYRAGRLFSNDVSYYSRPLNGSISRMNFQNISSESYRKREGTSPGLVANFLISAPYPLNFLLLIAYSLVAMLVINLLLIESVENKRLRLFPFVVHFFIPF